MNNRHWLFNFFRWDVRTILAGSLGLLVVVGFALAADTLLVQFDFGGGSLADKASGMVAVKGGVSAYPVTTGNLQFGWTTVGITEHSDSSVSDLMKRDYNTGPANSIFKISGLEQGTYTLKATVGASDVKLSTRIQVGSLATSTTADIGTWRTASLIVPVDNSGVVEIGFSGGDNLSSWGICGLAVYRTTGTVSPASFSVDITPSQKTVTAGSPATFNVGVTSLNNYGSKVQAQISGLVSGMTAEFIPAELAVLPGTMQLTVYTSKTVSATDYDLLVTVVGQDVAMTKKTTTIGLTVKSPNDGITVVPVTNITGNTTNTPALDLPLRTPQETKEDFANIDAFAEEQRQKALNKNNFNEIKAIGDSLSSIPVYEGPPKPKTTTEVVLQKLVQGGIISSTTDSAPAVQQAEPKPGFWKGLWQSIFKPTL